MQLQLLWKLQQYDLAIMDLEKKAEEAPALSGKDELAEQVENLKTWISAREEALKAEKKALKRLELITQKIVDDRKDLKENMYGGKVTNVKELEQMMRKMDLLAVGKLKHEEEILAYMETIEEYEEQLKSEQSDLAGLVQKLEEVEKQLEADLQKLEAEKAEQSGKRDSLAVKIEPKYMDRYKNMAQRNNGYALAAVEDDVCGGCRVFISSAQRGQLYNPDTMVYCENCGRLLVRL